EPLQHAREVLEEAALELVHADAARRVRRVDAGDPVGDPALSHDLGDLVRDVADAQTPARPKLALVLEDLHRTLLPRRSARIVTHSGAGAKRERTARWVRRRPLVPVRSRSAS